MISKSTTATVLFVAASSAFAQFTPLASKRFTYSALPYQADVDTGERGHQYGYNICNSTTQNQESLCQTAIINSIDDFCLWGPPERDSLIGDTEGEAVAWCTQPRHGTRVIPAGTITGLQFIRTPDYVQVTGTIRQENINIARGDSGGEMDPHGADQRGNPLGGLLFSNAWGGDYVQAVEWHNFMGGDVFCLKACDPAGPNAARMCEHIYDRIGCWHNAPAPYEEGVFESCLGENQDFPGIYTGEDGVTSTYTQPPEGVEITSGYPVRRPASSSCVPYESASLFAAAASVTAPAGASSTSAVSSGVSSRTTSTRSSATRSSTGTASVSTDNADSAASRNIQVAAGSIVAAAVAVVALL